MKTILALQFLLFSASVSVYADQVFSPNDLLGRWESISTSEKGSMEFREDGTADILNKGKSVSGQIADADIVMRYSVDTIKRPMHLDVFFIRGDKEIARWKFAFRAVSPNRITLRVPHDLTGELPTSVPDLGSGGEVSTFTKIR